MPSFLQEHLQLTPPLLATRDITVPHYGLLQA